MVWRGWLHAGGELPAKGSSPLRRGRKQGAGVRSKRVIGYNKGASTGCKHHDVWGVPHLKRVLWCVRPGFLGVAIAVTLDSRQKEAIDASYSSCWCTVGGRG